MLVSLTGGEILMASQATAEVFFTAFKSLKNKEKEAFLEKIISDPGLSEAFEIDDNSRLVKVYNIAHRREAYK